MIFVKTSEFVSKTLIRFFFTIFFSNILCAILVSCGTTANTQKSQDAGSDSSSGTSTDYYNENRLRFENRTYRDYIKTVQLSKAGFEMSTPVIELNTNQQMSLNFDDLEGGVKNYYYTFIHCTADWKPSDLSEPQYINGFTEDKIINYSFSFNTIQKYTHYQLSFPDINMRPVLSGNYLLLVFEDYNREKIVLSRRFMIVDFKVGISARVHRATLVSDREKKQELDFVIDHSTYPITNPMGDLKVILQQNDAWDHVITNLKPLFISENQLDYNYDEGNVFDGENEYRMFDIRSLRLQTEFISKITYDSLKNHVYLKESVNRSRLPYFFENDINGKYVVKVSEGRNNDIEADYTYVHFRLACDEPIVNGNVYVEGAMTDNQFNNSCKMKYHEDERAYEGVLYLKQGYYNYHYVFLKDGSSEPDGAYFEGNHSETENDYSIYVYHRPPGSRYDMLIGLKQLNSIKLN